VRTHYLPVLHALWYFSARLTGGTPEVKLTLIQEMRRASVGGIIMVGKS
jgi:hypothetical protein